jgi:serine/threonine protein kinase
LIILYGVAHVLERLHCHNSVHCDVKSLNVFLDKDLEPHLGDFGFACNTYTVTHTAPEILNSEGNQVEYGSPMDVWAFRMLMFEVQTGEFPFIPNIQSPHAMPRSASASRAVGTFRNCLMEIHLTICTDVASKWTRRNDPQCPNASLG